MSQVIYQPTINIKKKTDILWSVIGIEILRIFGVSDKILFLLIVFWMLLVFWKMRKIVVPKIKGISLYVIFIAYSSVIGLILYDLRNVERDLFYILPTVIIIYTGYIMEKGYSNKSILKTLYVMGTLISLYALFQLITNIGSISDLSQMREYMGTEINEVCIIFSALIIEKIIYERIVFTKTIDFIMVGVMLIQLALSLGRTIIGQTGVVVVVMFVFATLIKDNKADLIKRAAEMSVLIVVVIIVAVRVLPPTALEEFTDKWDRNIEEIDSDQEFDSTAEAMLSWRAFEIQSSQEQWKNSNLVQMLLGNGMGAGIRIKYTPYNWLEFISESEIPLLHNCYYTILTKGGLFGVIALLTLYLSGVFMFFKYGRRYKDIQCEMLILAVIGIGMMFNGYFVRGIINQEFCLSYGLIVGCVNYKFWETTKHNKLLKESK